MNTYIYTYIYIQRSLFLTGGEGELRRGGVLEREAADHPAPALGVVVVD